MWRSAWETGAIASLAVGLAVGCSERPRDARGGDAGDGAADLQDAAVDARRDVGHASDAAPSLDAGLLDGGESSEDGGVSDAGHACDPVLCDIDAECPWDDWTDITGSRYHQCGLRADGTLWCWGRGGSGQRGDGTTGGARSVPIQVVAAGESAGGEAWDDWATAAAGGDHDFLLPSEELPRTCGIRSDGSLWCWGRDAAARGDGTDEAVRTTPSRVLASGESVGGSAWDDWVQVVVGRGHTCGLRADGSAWCWGDNEFGQLGDATTSLRSTPVRVLAADESEGGAGWDDWVQLSAGHDHTCGIRQGGSLWCWGGGFFCTWFEIGCAGQDYVGVRGDGTSDPVRTTPSQVLAADETAGGEAWEDWTVVAASVPETCGLRADGSAWCWGYDSSAAWSFRRDTPLRLLVSGVATNDWMDLDAAALDSCGLREPGTLWCWDADWRRPEPIPSACAGEEPWFDWQSIAAPWCGLRSDGTAWCWGRRSLPAPVPAGE
jgi:alpha-tubulin suppressor-like RCC1 family protein